MLFFFFFKQKTAYEMRINDWIQTCALPIWRSTHWPRPPGATRKPARRRPPSAQPATASTATRPTRCTRAWPDRASATSPASWHCSRAASATPAWRSEEHTSELQSLMRISYAVFCLKKKTKTIHAQYHTEYIHDIRIQRYT